VWVLHTFRHLRFIGPSILLFYSPRLLIYFDRQSLFMPFASVGCFMAATTAGSLDKGGKRELCQPSCCHSSAWFLTGVFPLGDREVAGIPKGKWHGPAFLGLMPFFGVCFKKRLGCQPSFFLWIYHYSPKNPRSATITYGILPTATFVLL